MYIAFRIYDADNDQSICKEEIKIILKNIPRQVNSEYGISKDSYQEVNLSRGILLQRKLEDDAQIDILLDRVFLEYAEDIYFDEFVEICEALGSDLYVAIMDCLYKCVPCVKNFYLLRANYIHLLQREKLVNSWLPNTSVLAPVYLNKL